MKDGARGLSPPQRGHPRWQGEGGEKEAMLNNQKKGVVKMANRKLIGIAVVLYIVVGLFISDSMVFGQNIGRPEDSKEEKQSKIGNADGQTIGDMSSTVIYTSCTWAYDYREGKMSVDTENRGQNNPGNSGVLGRIKQSWSCVPKTCVEIGLATTEGWRDLGVIVDEPLAVTCSGGGESCDWGSSVPHLRQSTHPVTLGRSVRGCLKEPQAK
ncbi:MAG TPA: hypothetical protein VJA84_02025 [Candidatus Omnitrophota bacterium]|nr:hypothetical protein [Candidatus Omnitrophota bacterium]